MNVEIISILDCNFTLMGLFPENEPFKRKRKDMFYRKNVDKRY